MGLMALERAASRQDISYAVFMDPFLIVVLAGGGLLLALIAAILHRRGSHQSTPSGFTPERASASEEARRWDEKASRRRGVP